MIYWPDRQSLFFPLFQNVLWMDRVTLYTNHSCLWGSESSTQRKEGKVDIDFFVVTEVLNTYFSFLKYLSNKLSSTLWVFWLKLSTVFYWCIRGSIYMQWLSIWAERSFINSFNKFGNHREYKSPVTGDIQYYVIALK